MNIVFKNRNFQGQIPQNFKIEVDRYSFEMIGGPAAATLKIKYESNAWEATKLLRCPVEFYENGKIVWWGFVNRVVVPYGDIRVGVGLDNLYNSVSAIYNKGITSLAMDAFSNQEYGEKQFLINLPSAIRTEAEAYRDGYLLKHKYEKPELDLSGKTTEISVECLGWFSTLNWKYYSNITDTRIDTITQIKQIIEASGQFVTGVRLETALSGITCTQKRDGQNTALNYIRELLNAGGKPLLVYIDQNRIAHISEQIDETTQYYLRNDGKLETLLNVKVPDIDCVNAVWVSVKDLPISIGSGVQRFFIEKTEVVANPIGNIKSSKIIRQKFTTHYYAAQSYTQTRLDQYLVTINQTGGGGITLPGGYGGGPLAPPVSTNPPADFVPSLKSALLVDPNVLGLMATNTLDLKMAAFWEDINTTLGITKGKSIVQAFIVPSGALYVLGSGGGDAAFLAKAPSIGGDFVEIFNKATADDYFGTGSTNSLRIQAVCNNPMLPDEVIFRALNSNGVEFFRVVNDTNFEKIAPLHSLASIPTDLGINTYGDGFAVVSGDGHVYTFPLDYSTVTDRGAIQSIANSNQARGGVSQTAYLPNTPSLGDLRKTIDNFANTTDITGLNLDWGADIMYFLYKMAVDATGTQILTRNISGGTVSQFSSDGGSTFLDVSDIPSIGCAYAFAGSEGVDSRWLAAGSGKVMYSEKAADEWIECTGNLTALSPTFGGVRLIIAIPEADFPIIPIDPIEQQQAQQQFNQGYIIPTATANVITDIITNGDTTHTPSGDAVFDALALKEDSSNKKTTMTGNTASNVFYLTAKAIYDWATSLFSLLGHSHSNYIEDAPIDGLRYIRKDANWNELIDSNETVTIMRWVSSGGTTYDLPDIAQAVVNLFDDGALVDPLTYSLSTDGTQITTDSSITSSHVVVAEYIQAQG